MATPHLCSKKETFAADQHTLGSGKHLLILTQGSTWTNKEFIATPVEEYYSMAATYGDCSTYSQRPTGTYADGNTMSTRLKNLRDAKQMSHWAAGHKPIYHYCARSMPPYRIWKDANLTETKCVRSLEFGANWVALKFNTYALPIFQASKFQAFLRVWNPSCIHTVDPYGFEPILHGRTKNPYCYTYLYNNSGRLHCHFDTELGRPNQCEATNFADLDLVGNANQGNTGGATHATIEYDIYGAHLGTASEKGSAKKSFYKFNYCRIYSKSESDHSAYYKDIEITGNGLTQLKNCMAAGGSVWLHAGFNMANITSEPGHGETMMPYSTFLAYTSRIELRLVVSMSRYNY